MINTNIYKTLKDGIVIKRNRLTLNINKDRRYTVLVNGKCVSSNLLFCEVLNVVNILRK